MNTITIRQKNPGSFEAELSIAGNGWRSISIENPFSKLQEDHLEWYFEHWISFPFTDKVKAQTAANSVNDYGQMLFQDVFKDPEALAEYISLRNQDFRNTQLEIIGEPEFHALHWEALKDPNYPQAISLRTPVIRKHSKPQSVRATFSERTTINLLLVTARPRGVFNVGYRTISRPLVDLLKNARLPINIDILRPGSYETFVKQLEDKSNGFYHIVHFDMHGSLATYEDYKAIGQSLTDFRFFRAYARDNVKEYEGYKAFLAFEPQAQDNGLVEADALAQLLIKYGIPIAILNACQSGKQIGSAETSLASRLMTSGVQTVLAMGYSVSVTAAEILMKALYQNLFDQKTLSEAIRRGRTELYNQKERRAAFNHTIELEDWLLPVVYQNEEPKLNLKEMTAEESAKYWQSQITKYHAKQPTYGFWGRDIDILNIERALLKHNLILVRGMGGAGKTTLLTHLGEWWQTTHFVNRVFYFGYNEKAYTAQQIIHTIAEILIAKPLPNYFLSQPEAVQQAHVVHKLRSDRHLLILDNLESVTGIDMAIMNTLPESERIKFKLFLAALKGGRTLIVLGSRSPENWLKEGTFEQNLYDLTGLDPEAASNLTKIILDRNSASRYLDNDKYPEEFKYLQNLLELLAGIPLQLEVVLSNLKNRTPKQIFDTLYNGLEDVDFSSNDKTKNLIKSIEYTYKNFQFSEQILLLCFAPFRNNFSRTFLQIYIDLLQQHSDTIDFLLLQNTVDKAIDLGLIIRIQEKYEYCTLNPILPYFLREKLQSASNLHEPVWKAFIDYMIVLSGVITNELNSAEPQNIEQMISVMKMEYENIYQALEILLSEGNHFYYDLFRALSLYLNLEKQYSTLAQLNEWILSFRSKYADDDEDDLNFLQVQLDMANAYAHLNKNDMADEIFTSAFEIINQYSEFDDEILLTKANILNSLGILAVNLKKNREASKSFTEALTIYRYLNEELLQAGPLMNLGISAQESRNFNEAENYYKKSLVIFEKFDEHFNKAKVFTQLGNVMQLQEKTKEAFTFYHKALEIYQEFNEKSQQANLLYNLGLLVQKLNKYDDAEYFLKIALEISYERNEVKFQAKVLQYLGYNSFALDDFNEAEEYYNKALIINVEIDEKYSQATCYQHLGMVAEAQKKFESAKAHYFKALQILEMFEDYYAKACVWAGLGIVFEKQQNWAQAKYYLSRARDEFIDLDDPVNLKKVDAALSRIRLER